MESVDETKGLKPVPAAAVAEGQDNEMAEDTKVDTQDVSEEMAMLHGEADAAVDPPEALRHPNSELWTEVMWRMRWLVSKSEAPRKVRDKPKALSLGEGWVLMQSRQVPGRRFYFNMKSGESSWKRPF
eukprot:symbB.v1.2.018182.t1/scaffold1436.1/size118852/5